MEVTEEMAEKTEEEMEEAEEEEVGEVAATGVMEVMKEAEVEGHRPNYYRPSHPQAPAPARLSTRSLTCPTSLSSNQDRQCRMPKSPVAKWTP